MIVLNIEDQSVQVLNIGNSLTNFFAKVSYNNPDLSSWITVTDKDIEFSAHHLDRFINLCFEQYLTVETR